MALSAFDDKAHPPAARALKRVLGKASDRWDAVLEHLAETYPPTDLHWGYSGKAWGWGLRVRQRKRAILYLTPCEGFFHVGFALGEKAVSAALATRLPKRVVDLIEDAPRYAEGRGVRIPVRSDADLPAIRRLAAVKMGT